MKFTSEDLLKAMGLKENQTIECIQLSKTLWFTVKKIDNQLVLVSDMGGIYSITMLMNYNYTIIQPKPTLTEDEKVILRNLPKECKWIARDSFKNFNRLYAYPEKPNRLEKAFMSQCNDQNLHAFNHLFQFIKWEDEPYSIEELLKD